MSRQDYPLQLNKLPKGAYKKQCIVPPLQAFYKSVCCLKEKLAYDNIADRIEYVTLELNCATAIRNALSLFLTKQDSKSDIQTALKLVQAWLDHANAARLIMVLQSNASFQQCIGMLNHIYCVQRCMDDNALTDGNGLEKLAILLQSLVLHYQDKGIIQNKWVMLVITFLSKSIDDIRSMQGDRQYSRSILFEAQHKIQARIATLLNGMPNTLGLRDFLCEEIPETQIKLLGGVDPLVFQIRYDDRNQMILRLYQNPLFEANLQAQVILREHYPNFVGQFFYESAVGEVYCYATCSEFFAQGTLADYIKRIHEHQEGAHFGHVEQTIFFNYFKQILEILITLHQHHVYFSDSKPSNFLFNKDPLEVGSALVISDLKSLGMLNPGNKTTYHIAYTADYAAPEVLKMKDGGDAVNPYAQDIYAFAMTFLEYLIGDRTKIQDYKPCNIFEITMYGLLKNMLHSHPLLRLEFSHFLYQKIQELESELFSASHEKVNMLCSSGGLFAAKNAVFHSEILSFSPTVNSVMTHSLGDKS